MSKSSGLTLVEMMLVLAIASVLITMAINQYRLSEKDSAFRKMQYTVDILFQGMSNYYIANCRNPIDRSDPTGSTLVMHAGSLDPRDTTTTPQPNPFPIITGAGALNLLVSNGILGPKDWPPLANELIDTTAGDKGYVTQFNLTDLGAATRSPTAYYNNWMKSSDPQVSSQLAVSLSNVGRIYKWRSQVAVKINGTEEVAKVYANRLGANCTSKLENGVVTPCTPTSTGQYVVWERSPTYGSANTRSLLWLTTRRIKQSNQLYTNDDMYGASNANWVNSQGNVYLCGG